MNSDTNSSSFASAHAASPYTRSPEQQLLFRIRRRGEIVVLSARGQADAYTLPLWRQEVGKAVEMAAAGRGALIVDTTRLEFLSLRTLAALAEDAQHYRGDGIEICLVTPNPRIARLAGDDPRIRHLPVCTTVVSALTSLQLRRQNEPRPPRPQPYRPPQITREEPDAEHDRLLRELAQRN
ncbi:STAS domain-containing protein [Nocardia flavorosea]|uniref:STAS domain-containing protein n=1 Tax=Nocardia flavorosea TaxID=53429 RepID=A0A846YMX7_9NOCA|nr:STAS domain-containing protein [Nocardia flavorosea]NKY58812.1 hypothetical protein [Nocardia flavorosea]